MGLFDSLKNTALGKIVDAVEKTAEKTIGNFPGTATGSGSSYGGTSTSRPSSNTPSVQNNSTNVNANINIDQMFDRILATEFSNIQVVKNASPESVGVSAPHPCKPYSYALLRNGKAAVLIMLTPHNRDRNSAFLNAKKSALNSNIKFLNFYTHFPNEQDYVVSRIKNAL